MLRVEGLECLVSILKCMVEWSRDYYIDPATTGLNTVRVIRGEDAPGQLATNEVTDGGRDVTEDKLAVPLSRHGTATGKSGMGTGAEGEETKYASLEEFEMRKQRKEKMQHGIQL